VPTELDTSLVVADVYADALLELANERGQADEVYEELLSLKNLFDWDEDFRAYMLSRAVDDDVRREGLKRIFGGRMSEMVVNTLLVMNDHDRAGLIDFLVDRYKARLDEQKGREDVFVTTAVGLDPADREGLRGTLAALIGRQPVLVERVDAGLIGGMVVRVGDRQIDGSVRRKLAVIREGLAGRGESELLAGKEFFEASS
jgi:F-type H+-transporting ATPase subunit delta